jgi:2-iminobutanoate/2-iminopropanoate deaminase
MTAAYSSPTAMSPPIGLYSHVALAHGFAFFAGQVGADPESGENVALADQVRGTFANLDRGLAAVGAGWNDIVSLTTFLVGDGRTDEYALARAEVYRDIYGDDPYPPHTLAIVSGLAHPALLVEMNAIAALQ